MKIPFPPRRRVAAGAAAVIGAGAIATAVVAVAQTASFAPRPKLAPPVVNAAPPPGVNLPGAPLVGLNDAQAQAFTTGREEFEAVETPEGGLGPIFNDRSCAACHDAGGIGGGGPRTVTRFGRRVADGRFDALAHLGGSLLQARAIDPAALERIPPQANVVARRVTTPLFGAGLIEAIDDLTLELQAQRPKPDGVRGRVHRVVDVASGQSRVGRFGWKAQHATLLSFSADAYLNEMGVTNRFFPTENAPNGRADLLARFDRVPDIEDAVNPATGRGDVDALADFMRLLAPPPTLAPTAASVAGQRLFEQARCTACHVPSMNTGASAIAALAHQPVRLYSDLLLHDMGTLGDGIEQGSASGREMRTAPLWGLRLRPSYLHDGRARTVAEAIAAHGGEAGAARQRYQAMSAAEQRQLLEFLRTL
ncbi:di-heme oxidoredictase family protein [Aquabacterium humicola]|uniref:di-heme oxidoredictase family protein n=1 Tax=Aquabacterium humicola TaxID=3237377 RepID=UPI002542A338|nr:di-heme oxidoredictase family protein [Rubrivivax pictus]